MSGTRPPRIRGTAKLLLLLLLAIAPMVGAWGARPADAGSREPTPLQVFAKHYKSRDAKIRRKAVGQLEPARGPKVVAALVTALGDEDRRVRERAGELLRVGRGAPDEIAAMRKHGLARRQDEAVRIEVTRALAVSGRRGVVVLRDLLKDRQADVRRAAARGLGEARDTDASRDLHAALLDDADLVRAAAIESIHALHGEEAVGAASGVLLGDRAGAPKVAAAGILALYLPPAAVDHVVRGLGDRVWSVRVACARALAAGRKDVDSARAAAAGLVPALEREPRRRVRLELAETLRLLTGIDFGPEPDRWRAWFNDVGRTFEPPARPVRKRQAYQGSTQEGLLDLPIDSEHVVFVLDQSHSMNEPLSFGGKRTRRDAVLGAFERAVNRLPETSWMNLIVFGTEPAGYKPRLFEATRNARRGAVKFLGRRAPDGRTNLYDSLVLALADRDADTIVVLTDGAPSEGARQTRRGILDGVRELNRYRLARLHTVEVGSKQTSKRWRGFMSQLAEAGDGHYLAR